MTKVGKLFSQRLKTVRIDKNLTQEELARLAKLSLPTVQALENGRNWPSRDSIERISKALGVNESFLFFDPENIPPEEVAKLAAERLGFPMDQQAPKRVAHPRKKKS